MSDPHSQPQTDPAPEWTPQAQAALKRARRGAAFSVGLMLLGFMAVGAAIVYRVTRPGPDAPAPGPAATLALALPAGAEVVSASTANGLVTIAYTVAGQTRLRVFNSQTGALAGSYAVVAE